MKSIISFVSGAIIGVYISQTYQIPNVSKTINNKIKDIKKIFDDI